ncbi:MAG: hypothetical protein N2254_04355 [bacterium]|nr:hypothetical protein [bacterium]MDW8086415.1 hypothetical protein [Candidatus Calescibacterium sp.]
MMVEKERYLVFHIDDKIFAIDIDRVKKVIKEKGDSLRITGLDQAPKQVIGIAEVEITQNEKKLITFIDFKSLSGVKTFLQEYDNIYDQDSEKTNDSKGKQLMDSEKMEEGEKIYDMLRRRVFVIISHPEKENYIGILVNRVEGISDFINGKNAYFYEAPNIRGVKDLFTHVIISYPTEKKIFVIKTEKIFEMSGVD